MAKGETRFQGFDDKILSLYARGMTTREIQGHLEEIYQVEVSPALISNVTDAVIEEVKAWQSRHLDAVYPVVYLDALVVKMRDNGRVENRVVYVAIGIALAGQKEVLGLWPSANEGAKFWLQVLTEMQNRGLKDILHRVCGWAEGFPSGDRNGVSENDGAVVHRAHGAGQLELRELETAQAGGARFEIDLSRGHGRRGGAATGRLRRGVGPAISFDQRALAKKLAGRDSVLSVPARDTQNRLHHQRHREPEHEPAQGHQDPRRISLRRRRPESDVSGAGQKMECRAGLEGGPQPFRTGVGSALPTPVPMTTMNFNQDVYTKYLTLPLLPM